MYFQLFFCGFDKMFFVYDNIHAIQNPKPTRRRGLQSKRHTLWRCVGNITASYRVCAHIYIIFISMISYITNEDIYKVNDPVFLCIFSKFKLSYLSQSNNPSKKQKITVLYSYYRRCLFIAIISQLIFFRLLSKIQ